MGNMLICLRIWLNTYVFRSNVNPRLAQKTKKNHCPAKWNRLKKITLPRLLGSANKKMEIILLSFGIPLV